MEVKPLQTTAVDAKPPASPVEAAAVQGADAASGRAVLRRASPGLAPADPGDAPRRPDVAHEHLHMARHPSRALIRRSADDRDADPVEQEADAVAAHAVAACIVDSAPAPHQREARDFMTEMERRVTETASRELGPTWTAAGCPYIAGLFQAHERSDAATIERLARVYSRRSDVASAEDYFPPILARVEAAVRTWRSGGDISGELRELGAESLAGMARVTALQAAAPRRKADAGARDAVGDDAWEAAAQRPGDAGAPLPSGVQRRLARGFGRQFPEVRIHTDDTAAERTAGIRAQAFTLGTDISFARGRYRPGTLAGEALIAHELAHVLQQDARNAGRDVATAGAPALEKNADALAGAALLARPGRLRYDAGGLRLQRCPEAEPMTDQEFTEYVATKHLRIVVQQDTKAFLSGMKKSFAVAANEDPAVTDINLTEDDEVVTNLDLDYPRLRAMRFQVPMSGGERMTPITTVHRQTGTWPVALMFPGRYDMTAWVNFGAGRVVELKRSIDVAQADFAGESAKSAPEDLKAVPANTIGLERTTWTVQRAKLRQQAVDAGLLTAGVNTAWTDLSIAVVTRAGALQQGIGVEGTGTQVLKAATAFAAAMPGAPATLISAVSALRARAFVADLDRLRTAFEFVSDAFDTWVLAQLEGKEKGKDILAGLKYAASIDKELVAMKARASQAPIRVPAVFHPEDAYVRKEFLVGGPISTGKIVSIPLNLWLLNTTGQTWVLRDISNPEKTFEYKETNARRDAALDILLKKLAKDQERFPNGRLHVQPPGRVAQVFVIEGEMTYLDWLGVAALVLAAAGLIAVTAGTATPAVAAFGGHLLTVSAATGAAIAVADTVDAYERGQLTPNRLALNAFQFVASIASAGTSRIVAGAAKAGTLAQIGADSRYVLLNRVAAGGDIATLAVMTVDTAHSLLTLSQTGGKGEDAGLRAALAVGQLLAQGTLTIVAAKDTFKGDLSAHPSIELLEETPGQVVVRNPGAAAAAVAATPSTASRTLEDLLAKGGKAFAADHAVLRDAYDAYAKAARRRGTTPLEPLEWAKFVTQGKAAKYLNETLGDGWRAARRAEYPGSRPQLIDRPTAAPAEGSIDPNNGRQWTHRRVLIGDIKPEMDALGEPWWTFPDLVENEVLILPSGTRVWRHSRSKAIFEEHPLSASVSGARARTAGESTIPSAIDMGPAHQKGKTERAHGAASPGLGFDSPYSVAHAPQEVNQVLENNGIETYLRRLRDNAPDGVTYLSTTATSKSGLNLRERVYRIDAIKDGKIHHMFEFKIVVEGAVDKPKVRFATDEVTVFLGAEAFGAPVVKGLPAGTPPESVGFPAAFQARMGSAGSPRAKTPASDVSPVLEKSKDLRTRLDAALQVQFEKGRLDQTWLDAQERLIAQLDAAEARLLDGTVDEATRTKLDGLLTNVRSASSAKQLGDLTKAIRDLFP